MKKPSSDKEILTECKQFHTKLYKTGILDTNEVMDNYWKTSFKKTVFYVLASKGPVTHSKK